MTQMGQHEEALLIMRGETDNDFFYFNKLKYKLEQEGKYKYEESAVEKARRERFIRNRFAHAIDMEFIDYDVYLKASAVSLSKNTYCLWRGHTSDGKELRY